MKKKTSLKLTEEERDSMRKAGKFNAELMDFIRPYVKESITSLEIDKLVYDYTVNNGYIPATLNYMGFPNSCCVSVNDTICHGIPNEIPLKNGDIVNIDLTTIVDGWHGDQSETFMIGDVSDDAKKLVQCSFDAMWLAIEALKPNDIVKRIGEIILNHTHKQGFSVVVHFQGHGIGKRFHQKPDVPHFPSEKATFKLKPGICFTIEPMINQGNYGARLMEDRWTAKTIDNSLSAQFEHTILMTENGPEVLTLTKNGPQKGHKFA